MKNKKKIIIVLITIFLTSFLTFVITYKLHDTIKNIKNGFVEKRELKFLHENIDDIKKLRTLKDEANAWYMNYHFISHGGGYKW